MSKICKIFRAAPLPESDSFTSFFTSWQKNRAPPIYPNAQTGRVVTPTEFLLFFVAVVLLVLAVGLIVLSSWSLFFRPPYHSLATGTLEPSHFAFPAAVLCLPCFWITLSIHNDDKSRGFMPLLLLLLTFSAVLAAAGVYAGFSRRPDLEALRHDFRRSLRDSGRRKAWDEVQTGLGCCGVDNYTDWFGAGLRVPDSCNGSTSSVGCFRLIVADLALRTFLFSGINSAALAVQCCASVVLVAVYLCRRREGTGFN